MSDPAASLRAEVMAQPAEERLDYALDLLAYYFDPVPAFVQGCGVHGLALAPFDLGLLYVLWRRRGRYVSIDSLVTARAFGGIDDPIPAHAKVISRLSAIRGALAARGVPIAIDYWRGVGYRLEAAEGFDLEVSDAR